MDEITIYQFTNGRSTFHYSNASLKKCVRKSPIHVVKNSELGPALNSILETCKTPYFIKVDDDFFLHPESLRFMASQIPHLPENWVFYCCILWDNFWGEKRGNIKLYNIDAVKQVGGFHPNKYGRIDCRLLKQIKKHKKSFVMDKSSAVGIHVLGSPDDIELHKTIWGGFSRVDNKEAKTFYGDKRGLKKIFRKRNRILEKINEEDQSKFFHWLKSRGW